MLSSALMWYLCRRLYLVPVHRRVSALQELNLEEKLGRVIEEAFEPLTEPIGLVFACRHRSRSICR